jgi:hypothetical protein
MLADIGGQVSASPANPVVTVAAVAISSESRDSVRRRLVSRFDTEPVKWKRGRLEGLRHVVQLCATYSARVMVIQVRRDSERWTRFYEQAMTFKTEARDRTGRTLAYLDGDEVMRMFLFGTAFAELTGRLLRARHPWGDRHATINIDLVVDTDLKEGESRDHFLWTLQEWTRSTALPPQLKLAPSVHGRVETEQQEPLLLLPDYIAGIFQHADSRARLDAPLVSPSKAGRAVENLRHMLSPHLYELAHDFVYQYPLEHRAGRLIQRGDEA